MATGDQQFSIREKGVAGAENVRSSVRNGRVRVGCRIPYGWNITVVEGRPP